MRTTVPPTKVSELFAEVDAQVPIAPVEGASPAPQPAESATALPGAEVRPEGAVGGVYQIHSNATGGVYVGGTIQHLRQRWLVHLHYLRTGKHHAKLLQAVYDQHGEEDLRFSLVEWVQDKSRMLEREQAHIDAVGAKCINGAPIANGIYAAHAVNRGRVMPEDERRRRSAVAKLGFAEGRRVLAPWTAERRAAHAIALTGRKMPPVTQQTRERISQGHRLRHALLGTAAKPKTYRYAFIEAELPHWLSMRASGKSYRAIEAITGRCRKVVAREVKKAGAGGGASLPAAGDSGR
jgi:hypothetical protein